MLAQIVFRLPSKLSAAMEDTTVVTFLRRYQAYLWSLTSSAGSSAATPTDSAPCVDHAAIEEWVRVSGERIGGHNGHAVQHHHAVVSAPLTAHWTAGRWSVRPAGHAAAGDSETGAKVEPTTSGSDGTASAATQQLFRAWAQPIPEFVILAVQALASTLPKSAV